MVFTLILFPVICGKNPCYTFKGICKLTRTFISHRKGNGGDAFLGTAEHGGCLLDTIFFYVLVNGKSVDRLKNALQGRAVDQILF